MPAQELIIHNLRKAIPSQPHHHTLRNITGCRTVFGDKYICITASAQPLIRQTTHSLPVLCKHRQLKGSRTFSIPLFHLVSIVFCGQQQSGLRFTLSQSHTVTFLAHIPNNCTGNLTNTFNLLMTNTHIRLLEIN